jgi:hypothetical protein
LPKSFGKERKMKRIFLLLVVSFFLFPGGAVNAAVFNVSNPAEFQAALNQAASNQEDDTIQVAAGTYNLTNPLWYSPGPTENYRLTIQGEGADVTILNGGGGESGQILLLDNRSIEGGTDENAHQTIRGLAFTGGSASEGGGVAIYTHHGNITVENCLFAGNFANFGGGAFLWTDYGTITLAGNTFNQNSANYDNGGAFIATYGAVFITNNNFSQNTSQSSESGGGAGACIYGETVTLSNNFFLQNTNTGGEAGGAFIWVLGDQADATPTLALTNNSFANNSAYGSGGGLYVYVEQGASSNPPVTNLTGNSFSGNSISGGYGGGLYLFAEGSATFNRNDFVNNANIDSSGSGGGAYVYGGTLTLTNNIFSDNTAGGAAGGVHIKLWTEMNFINNTIVNNQANQNGGGIYLQPDLISSRANIYNNILWGNTATTGGDYYALDGNLSLTINYFNNDVGSYYSLCEDSESCSTTINSGNNISSDPQLSADLHLTQGSPCIDAGNNAAVPIGIITDYDGKPRIWDGNRDGIPVVDMGAYEVTSPAKNDFNGDGKPDILWRNTVTGANAVWFMDGVTLSGISDLPALPNPQYTIVGTGDFNGDGKPDILWRNTVTGANAVWFMNGVTLSGISDLPALPNPQYTIVGTGDFNGDGKPDILWRNTVTGANAVWFMDGVTLSGISDLPALPNPQYAIVGTGDFNGDRKPDILWRNTITGANAVWFMDGVTLSGISDLPALPNPDYSIVGE